MIFRLSKQICTVRHVKSGRLLCQYDIWFVYYTVQIVLCSGTWVQYCSEFYTRACAHGGRMQNIIQCVSGQQNKVGFYDSDFFFFEDQATTCEMCNISIVYYLRIFLCDAHNTYRALLYYKIGTVSHNYQCSTYRPLKIVSLNYYCTVYYYLYYRLFVDGVPLQSDSSFPLPCEILHLTYKYTRFAIQL